MTLSLCVDSVGVRADHGLQFSKGKLRTSKRKFPLQACFISSNIAIHHLSCISEMLSLDVFPNIVLTPSSIRFHIIANHSPPVNAFGNQLDYLGIVILMWGSTIPSVYYGFYCDPFLQRVYWTNVSPIPHPSNTSSIGPPPFDPLNNFFQVTIFAALCTYATLNPSFRSPRLRPYRALMYTFLGLSAISFVTHGIIKYGREAMVKRMSIDWMVWMAVLNLTGAAAYATRVPEALFPKKFDIWGSSHQWLHVLVIGAGIAHWAGLTRAFDFNHSLAGRC